MESMQPILSEEQLLRQAMFTLCDTREQLHDWVELYLGIDLPDCTVDPESNSNPMDLLWEMYSKARQGNDKEFQRVLGYAARDSFKSLLSSIFEVLCVLHLQRDVGHAAAIESQARVVVRYIKNYFKRKPLCEYVTMQNERRLEITKYIHKQTGMVYSTAEWEELPPAEKDACKTEVRFIQVVVATVAGMNSLHVPFMCLDELDLSNPEAVAESKYIPSIGPSGQLPITFLTSTRKFSFGLVQKEIDEAHESGLQIRHWNIIDVTEPCPPERHRPDLPPVNLWVEPGDPKRIVNEEQIEDLSSEQKVKLVRTVAYGGCADCRLYAACRGRLATKQKSKSRLLKPIDHVINQIRTSSPDKAAAQLMCWKPSTEGLVFPRLDRNIHMKTAAAMAELLTGDSYKRFSKADLIRLIRSMGLPIVSGMDFGFSDEFAVVTGALDGHRLFIFDVIEVAKLELSEKIALCDKRIKFLNPTIYPDQAYPADIQTFKRHGYRMMKFTKDVAGGIEAIRWKLTPGGEGESDLFILDGDEGCELLFKEMKEYHFKVDAAGTPTDIPEDGNDHTVDSLRYICQNLTKRSGIKTPKEEKRDDKPPPLIDPNNPNIYTVETWQSKKIAELTGQVWTPNGSIMTERKRSGRKGNFFYSL